jgi:hypothetical protein
MFVLFRYHNKQQSIFCVFDILNHKGQPPFLQLLAEHPGGCMADLNADGSELPAGGVGGQAARAALQALSGAIPLLGGLLSAAAGFWSERDQQRVNEFLQA